MFFDKSCNVSSVSYTKVGWTSKRTKASIYSEIECNFEINKKPLQDTQISKNSDLLKYKVVVPITYNLIRTNYIIELIDDTLWSLWDFIISNVQSFKSISWTINNISFTATEIQWQ
jgi:hypothetical protein